MYSRSIFAALFAVAFQLSTTSVNAFTPVSTRCFQAPLSTQARIQTHHFFGESDEPGEKKKETTWERITGPKLFKVRFTFGNKIHYLGVCDMFLEKIQYSHIRQSFFAEKS